MTPRSLFIIILRILGIISIKEILYAIPQLIATILAWFRGYNISDGLFMTFLSLISIAIFLWISYTLIFKAESLVTKFGLDQGFKEETLALNFNLDIILRIAIIVTGALLLLSEIPSFIRILYQLFGEKELAFMTEGQRDWSPAVFSGIRIILGLLIIGERNRILQLLQSSGKGDENKNKPEVSDIEPL